MSLYEKIFNIMNESAGLEKNLQVGSGSASYKAVGEAEVLNMLKPLFKKHRLIIFPVGGEITETNSTWEAEYNGKKDTKTRNVTQLKVNFKIVDVDTGETETLVGFGNGADSQDKGSGKAFTYAYKTALSKTFMLFSGEDTDNEHSDDIGRTSNNADKPKPVQENEPKKLSEAQVKRAYAIASQHGKKPEDIKAWIMKKYSKTQVEFLTKQEYDSLCEALEKAS